LWYICSTLQFCGSLDKGEHCFNWKFEKDIANYVIVWKWYVYFSQKNNQKKVHVLLWKLLFLQIPSKHKTELVGPIGSISPKQGPWIPGRSSQARDIIILGTQEEHTECPYPMVPRTDFSGLPWGDMDKVCWDSYPDITAGIYEIGLIHNSLKHRRRTLLDLPR